MKEIDQLLTLDLFLNNLFNKLNKDIYSANSPKLGSSLDNNLYLYSPRARQDKYKLYLKELVSPKKVSLFPLFLTSLVFLLTIS